MNHGMVPDNIQERLTSPLVCRNLTSLQASKIPNPFGPARHKRDEKEYLEYSSYPSHYFYWAQP